MTEAIGWIASVILLATMMRQVWTQWRNGSTAGVSHWLFIGQIGASIGFTIYSALLGNAVFVVTNALMLVNALVGLYLDRRNRAGGTAAMAAAPVAAFTDIGTEYRQLTPPGRPRPSAPTSSRQT